MMLPKKRTAIESSNQGWWTLQDLLVLAGTCRTRRDAIHLLVTGAVFLDGVVMGREAASTPRINLAGKTLRVGRNFELIIAASCDSQL